MFIFSLQTKNSFLFSSRYFRFYSLFPGGKRPNGENEENSNKKLKIEENEKNMENGEQSGTNWKNNTSYPEVGSSENYTQVAINSNEENQSSEIEDEAYNAENQFSDGNEEESSEVTPDEETSSSDSSESGIDMPAGFDISEHRQYRNMVTSNLHRRSNNELIQGCNDAENILNSDIPETDAEVKVWQDQHQYFVEDITERRDQGTFPQEEIDKAVRKVRDQDSPGWRTRADQATLESEPFPLCDKLADSDAKSEKSTNADFTSENSNDSEAESENLPKQSVPRAKSIEEEDIYSAPSPEPGKGRPKSNGGGPGPSEGASGSSSGPSGPSGSSGSADSSGSGGTANNSFSVRYKEDSFGISDFEFEFSGEVGQTTSFSNLYEVALSSLSNMLEYVINTINIVL